MMKQRISARLSDTASKRLHDLMKVYGTNVTETIEAAILAADVDKQPSIDKPLYHAEVSPHNDMVKCPIGKLKGHWVRPDTCRRCTEELCDIKR